MLNKWGDAFAPYGREVGQLWVSDPNLDNPEEREAVRNRIRNYLICGVVPMLNENDAVSRSKKRGQHLARNDGLARKVEILPGAQEVLFITYVEGVCECNPKTGTGRIYASLLLSSNS